MNKWFLISLVFFLFLISSCTNFQVNDFESDGIILMQHKDEGFYGCFGCGKTTCVDPIPEMIQVEETNGRYCDGNFELKGDDVTKKIPLSEKYTEDEKYCESNSDCKIASYCCNCDKAKNIYQEGSSVLNCGSDICDIQCPDTIGVECVSNQCELIYEGGSDQENLNKVADSPDVSWQFDGVWKNVGNPPSCPDPLILDSPVDVNLATSILYPGQYRGDDYKPHGGFRFDNLKNSDITIKAPMDAYVNHGSRYLADGEVQYLFEFINSCGIMYRFDHLFILSPKLQEIADTFPIAVEGDSRTTKVENYKVEKGEILGTSVGLNNNVFVDFGVYDLRNKNDISKDSLWLTKHDDSQAPYAVCWFNLLNTKDSKIVNSLPGGDSINGKQSDYC